MEKNTSISLDEYPQIPDENPGHSRRATIPVGTRFQADLSKHTNPVDEESATFHWLGTKNWPVESISPQEKMNEIGRGRPDSCDCQAPGFSECIKRHVDEEKMRLKDELGPAYEDWKFDQMGEDAAKNWTLEEMKIFESIVKRYKDFLEPAMKALPDQNRESIFRYYLNIIVPRRIGYRTRELGLLPTDIDTDDDENINEKTRASSYGTRSSTRKRSLDEPGPAGRRYLKE